MDKIMYDVIIVGAGPGGSHLGASLAKAGHKVLLLDKAQFPRYKICGGGVTKRALLKMPVDISPVIRQSINSFEAVFNGGRSVVHKHSRPFVYAVMRDELDLLLSNHAVACGVEFQSGVFVHKLEEQNDRVIVSTREREFQARYVVGADGVNSLVAKQIGLMSNRKKALALEYEIEVENSIFDSCGSRVLVEYGMVQDGYAWLFPKTSHCSVGVGSYSLGYPELSQALSLFLESHNIKGKILSTKGAFLSAGGEQQKIVTQRVALLGDAAGLVDPFAGEGIYYALWSAELLFARLDKAMSGESQAFDFYQADVDKLILPELQMLARLGRFFYSNTKIANSLLTHFPQVIGLVCRTLEGQTNYQTLAKRCNKLVDITGKIGRLNGSLARV